MSKIDDNLEFKFPNPKNTKKLFFKIVSVENLEVGSIPIGDPSTVPILVSYIHGNVNHTLFTLKNIF
jgi:hypothetical protein